MKYIYILIALLIFSACKMNDELEQNSIFPTEETKPINDFDKWILGNFTTPYNTVFNYRLDDKETDMSYNLVPANFDRAVALAKFTNYLWYEAYEELLGKEFVCTYAPKMIQLIGSPAYNSSGSIVLGTAEGGLKVTLYNVNSIDLSSIDTEHLNYWYFKTMHHEFSHILHQTKNYSTDFNLLSPENYTGGSWVNVSDKEALDLGFVSPYGSSEPQEDFVEIIAIFVTSTEADWNALIGNANSAGREIIDAKFALIKDYLKESWGFEIEDLRDIVQRRSTEVEGWKVEDLTKLCF